MLQQHSVVDAPAPPPTAARFLPPRQLSNEIRSGLLPFLRLGEGRGTGKGGRGGAGHWGLFTRLVLLTVLEFEGVPELEGFERG